MLELGTGTGVGTAWLLHGMDADARLLSIDNDASVQAVAAVHFAGDARLTLRAEDGDITLERLHAAGERYDLIFADSWPGKFRLLDRTLELLKSGAFYVVDDLLPQPNWPPNHGERVEQLLDALHKRADLVIAQLDWSTGVMVAVKREKKE
jgi:predicted O-methyltransferase YrrM